MKRLILIGAAPIIASLISCGMSKKDDSDTHKQSAHSVSDRDLTIGIYESSTELLAKTGADYFVISSDHAFYALKKVNSHYVRDYQANLSNAAYSFDGTNFSSGDYSGTLVPTAKVPQEFRLLSKLLATAKEMNPELRKDGMEVAINLDQASVAFVEAQLTLLRLLKSEIPMLKSFLKSLKADALRISDYTNDTAYLKNHELGIGTGMKISPADIVAQMKTKTLAVDDLN